MHKQILICTLIFSCHFAQAAESYVFQAKDKAGVTVFSDTLTPDTHDVTVKHINFPEVNAVRREAITQEVKKFDLEYKINAERRQALQWNLQQSQLALQLAESQLAELKTNEPPAYFSNGRRAWVNLARTSYDMRIAYAQNAVLQAKMRLLQDSFQTRHFQASYED